MSTYEHNGKHVVVNSLKETLNMPLTKGGELVKWTRVNGTKSSTKSQVVVAKDIPKGPAVITPTTPLAPAK